MKNKTANSDHREFLKKLGNVEIGGEPQRDALKILSGCEVNNTTLQKASWGFRESYPFLFEELQAKLGYYSPPRFITNSEFIKQIPPAKYLFYFGSLPLYTFNFEWPKDKHFDSNRLRHFLQFRRTARNKFLRRLRNNVKPFLFQGKRVIYPQFYSAVEEHLSLPEPFPSRTAAFLSLLYAGLD